MITGMTLEGEKEVIKIFKDLEVKGYQKPVKAAFKKAAQPVKKAMASTLPSNLKGVKKILQIKAGRGKSLTAAVGFYGNKGVYINSRGKAWNPYMLVYWQNYGTLANRDGQHKFLRPRTNKSAHKKGGIRPLRFVERAWELSQQQANKTFEKAWQEEYEKFLKQTAKK